MTSIRSNAFNGIAGDIDLTIPDSVASVGNSAFANCTGLTMENANKVLNSKAELGTGVFSGCTGLTGTLVIPERITDVPGSSFSGCTGLTGIEFPDTCRSVGSSAFQGCTGITKLVLPVGLITVGSSAFQGCTGLTEVVIPDTPDAEESIGSMAFVDCTALTTLTVPASATYKNYEYAWRDYRGPFNLDAALNSITVVGSGEMNENYGNNYAPWYAAGGDISVVFAEGVTSIRSNAFNGIGVGLDVTIPGSVEYIGSGAFDNCTAVNLNVIWNSCGHLFSLDHSYVRAEDNPDESFTYKVISGVMRIAAELNDDSLTFGIVGISDGETAVSALVIISGYAKTGRYLWTKILDAGADFSQVRVESADKYRMYLAEPDTFRPLCPCWESDNNELT